MLLLMTMMVMNSVSKVKTSRLRAQKLNQGHVKSCRLCRQQNLSEEIIYFLLFYFIIYKRDSACEQGRQRERERERERGNLKQAAHLVWSLTQGSIPQPWDHDLSPNQESGAQPTEPPRCPYLQRLLTEIKNTTRILRKAPSEVVISLYFCYPMWQWEKLARADCSLLQGRDGIPDLTNETLLRGFPIPGARSPCCESRCISLLMRTGIFQEKTKVVDPRIER